MTDGHPHLRPPEPNDAQPDDRSVHVEAALARVHDTPLDVAVPPLLVAEIPPERVAEAGASAS